MKAHPYLTVVVLIGCDRIIGGKPFGFVVYRKNVIPKATQSVVGSDPEIAFTVLEEASHTIPIATFAAGQRSKAVPMQTCQSRAGTHPQVAIPIEQQRADDVIWQAVARIKFTDLATCRP